MKRTIRLFLLSVIGISILVLAITVAIRAFVATRPLCDACNVIVIALDAVSADALQSPDSLLPLLSSRTANNGVVFTHAIAQSRTAYTSLVSLFTGNYPGEYGLWDQRVRVPEGTQTLASFFSSYGYETAGFSENPLSEPEWGLNIGFDHWEPSFGKSPKVIFENATRWLTKHQDEGRTFLFIQPYSIYSLLDNSSSEGGIKYSDLELLPEGDPAASEAVTVAYKKWMLSFDDVLDSFLSTSLESTNGRKTIVVLVGTYGEELTHTPTRGMGPGTPASFRMLNVPLVFLLPNYKDKSVSATVETRSIGKTLFDIVGIPASHGSASSLVRHIEKKYNQSKDSLSFTPYDPTTMVFTHPDRVSEIKDRAKTAVVSPTPDSLPDTYFIKSIIYESWHVTENTEGKVQLFNIATDPEEKYNLEETISGVPFADRFTISRIKGLIKISK